MYISDQFKVRYKGTFAEHSEWSEYFYATNTQMTLTGLLPGDRYQFTVYAVSDGKYSQAETIEESIRESHIDIRVHWWLTGNDNVIRNVHLKNRDLRSLWIQVSPWSKRIAPIVDKDSTPISFSRLWLNYDTVVVSKVNFLCHKRYIFCLTIYHLISTFLSQLKCLYPLGAGPGYVPDLREKDTGSTFVTFNTEAPIGVIRSWFLEYISLCKFLVSMLS